MGLWEAVVLAVVQGLTEFLPVSSSGHLVLFSAIMKVSEPNIVYEILLHFGTLLAVFVAFWKDIVELVKAALLIIQKPKEIKNLWRQNAGVRMLVGIVIGTIPAVIAALLFKDTIEELFAAPYFAGAMLLVTGTILYVTEKASSGRKQFENISSLDALVIGAGQAVAIIPGISRSGTTIGVGLLRGLDRESATRFSFLLTIPVILGALVLALGDVVSGDITTPGWILFVGTLVAAITGYVAIKFMLQVVRRGKLVWFAYYTWTVGAIILVLRFI